MTPAPPRTIALLFSDLVGSTALATEIGSARMEQVRRDHFAVLREAIARNGGTEVKGVGDGLMVACESATDAVGCAVAIQQGVELANRGAATQLAVRVGLAVGDAVYDDGDWYGPAAVEAARLCAGAAGGQILCGEVVRLLAAPNDPAEFHPVGSRGLKGLPGPVLVWSVGWTPLPAGAEHAPLPAPLRTPAATDFVGREREWAQLTDAWDRAVAGERRLVLISGEPGIGKTRLVTRLAVHAREHGARVLYGRSSEEAGLPYEPWRQVLAQLVDASGTAALLRHVERHGGDLARLAPILQERVGSLPEPEPTDPETERYLLFAAITGLVEQAAEEAPLLLVVDDVHWSGRPTLAVLRHIQLAVASDAPLLVVVTHRSPSPADALKELLEDLRREPTADRLALSGLSQDEVHSLLTTLDASADRLAPAVHRETAGNPFFVTELARHLVEEGAWSSADRPPLPGSVQDVIRGRVARLDPVTARLLRCAAVIGRDFEVGLLAAVEGVDEDTVLDHLDVAAAAALVTDSEDAPGHCSFVHALVSHALAAQLSAARRARLHRRIAEALEARAPADRTVGELATHWAAASGADAQAHAVRYAAAAGRAALTQLAPDEAVSWFERAKALEAQDAGLRRELLIGLGEAQSHAGRAEFRETLLEAAHQARAAGDHDRLVRAVLANWRGFASSTGFVDDDRVAVLEAALELTGPDDPRRARLLAQLAAELLWAPDHERRRALSDEAVALARGRDDRAALAHVLTLRATAVWWPATLPERCTFTTELVELTDDLNDPLQRFWARTWRAITLVQAGDLAAADRCLDSMREIAGRLAHPRVHFVMATQEAWRRQVAGDLDAAEQRMEEALTIGEDAGEPDAVTLYTAQLGPLRWQQGRLDEIPDLLEMIVEAAPAVPLFRAVHAVAQAEAGRDEDGRKLLSEMGRGRFADVPQDPTRLTALAFWSELASRLQDTSAAAALLEQVLPVRDQFALDSLGSVGAMSRCAGQLTAVLGRHAEARAHFADALATHERMGAASLGARTNVEWGEALGDRDALRRGAAAAEALGIKPLLARAQAALTAGTATPA